MKRHSPFAALAVASAVALALAACGTTPSVDESEPTSLTMTRIGNSTPLFGPANNSTGNDAIVNSFLFSNLVKVAPDETTLVPDLAETWEVSDDATTFTFTLRDDVTWSDGEPFTADDVIFTIGHAAQLGIDAFTGYRPAGWFAVEGAADVVGTEELPTGLKALDDSTVEVTLAAPNAEFLRNLTDAAYSILPEHVLAGVTAEELSTNEFATENPVGTGPYTLEKFVPNEYIQFAANPDYFGGEPSIDEIFFKVGLTADTATAQLATGELDLALSLSSDSIGQLEGVEGLTTAFIESPAAQLIQFRVDNPLASDVKVRQAIFYAIDRRAMLENLFDGQGAIRWVLPGFDQETGDLDEYPYDPEKATELLEESGFDLSAEFKIAYAPDADPVWSKTAPAIQQYLKDVGMNAVLEPLEPAALTAATTGPDPLYPMVFNSGGSMGLSPDRSSVYFNCLKPQNTMYANCDLDAAYQAARETSDPAERAEYYAEAAKILNRDVPMFALWQPAVLDAWNSNLGGTFEVYSNDRDTGFGVVGWTFTK
jgi:peptide/nickel transport system substrate-binding protein